MIYEKSLRRFYISRYRLWDAIGCDWWYDMYDMKDSDLRGRIYFSRRGNKQNPATVLEVSEREGIACGLSSTGNLPPSPSATQGL